MLLVTQVEKVWKLPQRHAIDVTVCWSKCIVCDFKRKCYGSDPIGSAASGIAGLEVIT